MIKLPKDISHFHFSGLNQVATARKSGTASNGRTHYLVTDPLR
jgi:hypothetical protein